MLRAIQMYFDEINENGGINGKEVELVIKDDKNDPEIAQKVVRELSGDKDLLGVIGHYYSSTALAVTDIYDKVGLVNISPYASNPGVTRNSKWVFSMNYQDHRQAGFMAVYLKHIMKLNNVLIVHNNDAYGIGLKTGFIEKAKKINLNISKVLQYDHHKKFGTAFIKDNISDAEKKEIEVVVIFSHSDSGMKLLRQLRDHGIAAIVMGPNTFAAQKFITEIEEKYTEDVYLTSPFVYDLANIDASVFREKYIRKYNEEPNISAPPSYDAAKMLAQAIEAEGADRKGIRDWLSSLNRRKPLEGITGDLYFDKDGAMHRTIYVTRIKDGRFKSTFTQLDEVENKYVFETLENRIAKGDVIVVDEVAYHIIDVVFVGVDFFRINDVDTKNMNFDADLFMWFKWKRDNVDIEEIEVINGIFAETNVTDKLKENLKETRDYNYAAFRVKGTYLTPYNLREFPFDTQILPLTIAHRNRNATHIMLVLDSRHMTNKPITEIYPQEWIYQGREDYSGTYVYDSTFGDPDYRLGTGLKSKVIFSVIKININLKRILQPYILTLFLPLVIMLIITLFVFLVPISEFAERLSLAMTALLSILVFHMTQSESLPNVGYIIIGDLYFILAYVFMFILICNIVLVNLYLSSEKEEIAEKLEKRFSIIFISVTIISYAMLTFSFDLFSKT